MGTTPPVESRTVPRIVPFTTWPRRRPAGPGKIIVAKAKAAQGNNCFIVSPRFDRVTHHRMVLRYITLAGFDEKSRNMRINVLIAFQSDDMHKQGDPEWSLPHRTRRKPSLWLNLQNQRLKNRLSRNQSPPPSPIPFS